MVSTHANGLYSYIKYLITVYVIKFTEVYKYQKRQAELKERTDSDPDTEDNKSDRKTDADKGITTCQIEMWPY